MSDTNEISVKITADARGLKEGLAEAAGSTQQAATQIREAGEEVGGFNEKLREFAGEQRSEGRLAGFMAMEFQKLGFGAKSAAAEVTGFVSAFAYGGALGVGVEALKFAVEKFNEFNEEENKSAENWKKWSDSATDGVKKFVDELKAADEAAGKVGTALKLSGAQHPLKAQAEELQKQLEEVKEKVASAREELSQGAGDQDPEQADLNAVANDKLNRVLKEQADIIDKLYQVKRLEQTENVAASPSIAKEQAEAELKVAQEHFKAHEQMQTFDAQEDAQQKSALEKKVAAWVEAEKKMAEATFKRVHAEMEEQAAAAKGGMEIAERNLEVQIAADKRMQEAAKKAAEEMKKETREEIATAEKLGVAIGDAMEGLASHTKSLGSIVAGFASQALGALAGLAEKTIENAALSAGANAASAEAGVPVIGPILAVGAIASMTALVRGLLGGVHSAEGGFDIGNFAPLTQLHPREMVLPAQYGDMIRSMAASGDGGGGGTAFHISAVDAKSVRRLFHENGGALMRTAKKMTSNRRKG